MMTMEIPVWKDPITDKGTKKSLRGLLRVLKVLSPDSYGNLQFDHFTVEQNCTWEQEEGGELQVVFHNGRVKNKTSLREIRQRINENLLIDLNKLEFAG